MLAEETARRIISNEGKPIVIDRTCEIYFDEYCDYDKVYCKGDCVKARYLNNVIRNTDIGEYINKIGAGIRWEEDPDEHAHYSYMGATLALGFSSREDALNEAKTILSYIYIKLRFFELEECDNYYEEYPDKIEKARNADGTWIVDEECVEEAWMYDKDSKLSKYLILKELSAADAVGEAVKLCIDEIVEGKSC